MSRRWFADGMDQGIGPSSVNLPFETSARLTKSCGLDISLARAKESAGNVSYGKPAAYRFPENSTHGSRSLGISLAQDSRPPFDRVKPASAQILQFASFGVFELAHRYQVSAVAANPAPLS